VEFKTGTGTQVPCFLKQVMLQISDVNETQSYEIKSNDSQNTYNPTQLICIVRSRHCW